jgi:DNA-binding ferritin-like protein
MLRAVHWSHWTTHWQVRGDASYGDHLLFERIYKNLEEEIDGLAEKIVSYYGAEAVDAVANAEFTLRFLNRYATVENPYERGLAVEDYLQKSLKRVYETLKSSNEMTLGLDDYLMATANMHETHQYLLRQRLRDYPPGE